MDCDEEETTGSIAIPAEDISGTAVNSLILDYYKKFGRKRDLEQYFSLSTAKSDVKDPSGSFWRKMKSENDSSDSGEKKSDSPQELCRISIRCSVPDPCSSQYHVKPTKPILTGSALLESLGINIKLPADEDSKAKSESVSPPIITEDTQNVTQNSDDESVVSHDNNSQKSFDILDTSANKPLSPSSSITSQRKLEWDSLADVGYANESDRKTSASSLSTLERLALKQQYSNNDTKLDSVLEPTAHSTPLDDDEIKSKSKKGVGKKTTKIHKKDVDYLEVNVPHSSENNPSQSINVNLTKHISFNVEKDGKVTVENIQKDVSVSPEKNCAVTEIASKDRIDKQIQTSLTKSKDLAETPRTIQVPPQKIPVLISLNTLRRQTRKKKLRVARKKLKAKKKVEKIIPVQEKSGEPLSEAESFEYMPGHMYNQNQLSANDRSGNTAGNKSSLESSGLLTTDSSKGSVHSFTKDLQKSIDILKAALQKGGDDKNLRKQLIKEVCERLLKSKYRDDESTSDFLSGLSFSSRKLGLAKQNHTTTSTSDNSADKLIRPKKSILRNDKFNSGAIASTSQSAPNLPAASNSDKLVSSNLVKNLTTSNTESDISHKEKSSSDNVFAKTSSQELYQRYLDALKREEAYKRHLKDKEMFLRQKLVCSDSAIKATRPDQNVNSKLRDLINDLTRNNYDDGSGDASKLEGGPNSCRDYNKFVPIKSQRSHSVFTLSSCGKSDHTKKHNLKKRFQSDLKDLAQPGTSRDHYCCCPHHSPKSKVGVIDSSVQVNIKRPCGDSTCEHRNVSPRADKAESPRSLGKIVADDVSGDIKYVCLCNNKTIQDVPDNFMIFKCSRMSKANQDVTSSKSSNASCYSKNASPRNNRESPNVPITVPCLNISDNKNICSENICETKTTTKSSQTNFLLKMLGRKPSERSSSSSESKKSSPKSNPCLSKNNLPAKSKVYEATRCLQTEISINPRIPEPTLSDINIVTDCARLVSEHCREVSKPLLTDVYSRQVNYETRTISGSSKSSGTSKDIGDIFDDNDVLGTDKNQNNETEQKRTQDSDSDRSEKFTIPIQGTNMTLMVSIGSNERKAKPDNMVAQSVGTDTNKVTEQATSLTEECSKGVQYNESPPVEKTDQNSNNVIPNNHIRNPCMINTCLTTNETFNTFPKTSPVNEMKPFRRANTDIDNFAGKCDNPENELKVDDNKCPCGCSGSKEHCKDKCEEKYKTKQSAIPPMSRKASVEKETQCSDKESSKCSCGCSGTIDKCNKNCNKRKKSYDINEERLESPKCLCGCGGNIEHCRKTCDERKTSISYFENRKKSVSTHDDDRKKSILSQCSCGCSGDIEKCNKNCNERKKSLEKRSVSPKCSCGCRGNIDNCKKDCAERKKSISSQCSCGCSGDKKKCNKNCSELKKERSKEIGIQKDFASSSNQSPRVSNRTKSSSPERKNKNDDCSLPSTSKNARGVEKSNKCASGSETDKDPDPILEMIQNITKKYSKKDIEKSKRKKCFKEIMTVLNYLLETEDSSERTDEQITTESSAHACEKPEKKSPCLPKKTCQKSKTKSAITESSECPQSTDIPGTSSDSATCKVLNKIKRECERYHQKRCKIHSGKKCDISSSTSANCEQCRRVHHCSCRNHKCKAHKKCEKIQKKAVAYNLILQTSESISEETICDQRQLQNIVVKVPSQKKYSNMPFKEVCTKIESRIPSCSPREPKACRSRSLPNESEISSMEEFLRKSQACCTVREYLEQNRPDFIAKSSQRQNCLRIVNDSRAHLRAAQRDLLSVRLAQLSDVNDLDSDEIRRLAKDLGRHMRQKRPAPKFISEREMKKHSEIIYKSLPEVVQKKEEVRKENIKRTNLLMANIFRKNLQKKTLRGSVDISNYSPIIKI